MPDRPRHQSLLFSRRRVGERHREHDLYNIWKHDIWHTEAKEGEENTKPLAHVHVSMRKRKGREGQSRGCNGEKEEERSLIFGEGSLTIKSSCDKGREKGEGKDLEVLRGGGKGGSILKMKKSQANEG
jgi:hypothetical protein